MFKNTIFYAESWNLAIREKKGKDILDDRKEPFLIKKNPLKFWAADPFLFEYKGKTYVFAELYDYIKCRGTLGYAILNNSETLQWKQVIVEDFHLSYPCIMEKDNSIYIMAESGADKSLYLYKAVDFPDTWQRLPNIRDNVVFGDTTPFIFNNKNYALTYDVKNSYKLRLLDLNNNENDCVIDCDNINLKRPAGKFFTKNGKILRPAQICENDYGEGIIFYEIMFDNQAYYNEKEIERIYPEDLVFSKDIMLCGMHTYNSTDKYEIVDIKTRRFNLLNFVFRIIDKFRH